MAKMRTTILALLLLAGIQTAAQAETAETESGYREVMIGLLDKMQHIIAGIMREQYDQVAALAENIAYHQGPPLEKRMALFDKLGIDGLTFKMHEDKVRQNALSLMKAATHKERLAVLDAYARLAEGCTECHSTYRQRIRDLHAPAPE